MKFTRFFALFFFCFSFAFSEIYHHPIQQQEIESNILCWEVDNSYLFDELLISWNATRPTKGYFSILVSVKTDHWSSFLDYAQWGDIFQKSFSSIDTASSCRSYQDCVEILDGKKGSGFKIQIRAENGADLSNFKALHVCASDLSSFINRKSPISFYTSSICLDVKGLSQMAIKDPRNIRLCSPTSTTAVVRFLNKDLSLDPLNFAENCKDQTFDIFGNWVLNVAQSYHELHDPSVYCWAERCEDFQTIISSLENGYPSVISIKGPIAGGALPYQNGHLIAVIGYDPTKNEVLCMDPAFKTDEETIVRYKLEDLLSCWERRKNLAYRFSKLEK